MTLDEKLTKELAGKVIKTISRYGGYNDSYEIEFTDGTVVEAMADYDDNAFLEIKEKGN
jgi:hypothetical protein